MKHYFSIGILFLSFISLSFSTSLFSSEDPLWELDSSNFKNVVHGKNKAWIILFYNNWCGHCIRFAPTWKKFAKDTKMWRKVIDVGAINCNDEANTKLCRHYDVQGYPTIKLFWHSIDDTDMGTDLEGNRNIESLEKFAINFLESNWNKGVPPNWPDITVLEFSSIKEVVRDVHMNSEGLYLFVENPESLVGRKVILDLSFQTSVIVRRILSTNKELLGDFEPELYNGTHPILLKVDKAGKGDVLLRFSENANATDVRDETFKFIVGHPREPVAKNDTKEMSNSKKFFITSVYMADLENAVYYSLTQEIGVTKNIDREKLSALKSFLSILKSYFPGSEPIMSYLSKLYNWVSYKRQSISGEEFVKKIKELQTDTEYLPKMQNWMGCRGSESRYRGYPCSLWTLFHTLTVQADIEYKDSQGNSESAAQTLFIIRDYIKNFFTCHECVENFSKMAENLENEVNSSQNAVLWLWEGHNKVNQRLAGDVTEDPKYPKIQFPSPKVCPSCRISGNTFNDTVWDRTHVLQYLHQFYGKQNIKAVTQKVTDSLSVDLKQNNSAGVTIFKNDSLFGSLNFKWFTNTDISLCVSLYVVSAFLIILICFIFHQRHRKRKFQFKNYLRLYH